MRRLAVFLLLVWPALATAQSREVHPGELDLTVTIENGAVAPVQGEMVLVTIHGRYRRHVTLETLEQPELDGFNWMQLGQDWWYETQEAGQPVKNFKRRMALFPDRQGEVTIGPFVHRLTLTDEGDDWFEHPVASEPVTLTVEPVPAAAAGTEWWFPVRRLEISDDWSNAPDQLAEGEGVLRVIRVSAVGASPEMIPPMPELSSPSAMIFAHPEKRLVELSPEGPVSIAFWRWTIRPTNGVSAILEPIEFDYFDTVTRELHSVSISAQRVAMAEAMPPAQIPPPEARLHPISSVAGILVAFLGALAVVSPSRVAREAGLRRLPWLDPLARSLRRAAAHGDLVGMRRHAARLVLRDGATAERKRLLDVMDHAIFARVAGGPETRRLARDFLSRRARTDTEG
ncbi:hypothetical protein OCH239_03965 [Roseivivax halodurans JCM 10272]|uniref:Protein BatD n=1 Tax=Roseivivax halodurans JCM 10272 TaxID=1449350 RepID=X7EDR7_9RHOB|nr:BatD family protein [Roseivivax halodurans]ETX14234.1 hypothetical protein OCH239_03965 [Roseivivax halodurans JCM 10272]